MTSPHTNVWCRYSNLSNGAGTVDTAYNYMGLANPKRNTLVSTWGKTSCSYTVHMYIQTDQEDLPIPWQFDKQGRFGSRLLHNCTCVPIWWSDEYYQGVDGVNVTSLRSIIDKREKRDWKHNVSNRR